MGNQFFDSYEISTLRHEKTDVLVNYTSVRVFRQGFGVKRVRFLTLRFTNSSVEMDTLRISKPNAQQNEFLIDVVDTSH